jgi:cation transport ATPase
MAVAADMGASLFVTFNALRLLKIDGVKKARQDL